MDCMNRQRIIIILTNTVKADDPTPKELTQVITGVELLDASDTKQNVTSEGDYAVRTGNAYKLRVTFDLKQYNENLNNGDYFTFDIPAERSEERRVGKECRSRWSPYH